MIMSWRPYTYLNALHDGDDADDYCSTDFLKKEDRELFEKAARFLSNPVRPLLEGLGLEFVFALATGVNSAFQLQPDDQEHPNCYSAIVAMSGYGKSPVIRFIGDLIDYLIEVRGDRKCMRSNRASLFDIEAYVEECRPQLDAIAGIADDLHLLFGADGEVSDPGGIRRGLLTTHFSSPKVQNPTSANSLHLSPQFALSIFGGIQPMPLSKHLAMLVTAGDGMGQRFRLVLGNVWPPDEVKNLAFREEHPEFTLSNFKEWLKSCLRRVIEEHKTLRVYEFKRGVQAQYLSYVKARRQKRMSLLGEDTSYYRTPCPAKFELPNDTWVSLLKKCLLRKHILYNGLTGMADGQPQRNRYFVRRECLEAAIMSNDLSTKVMECFLKAHG